MTTNALTPLGKELRKLRIDALERIADLAKALRCTSSFISAVELGKRSPPEEFLIGIVKHYGLDAAAEQRLRMLAVQSTSAVRIDLSQGENDVSRELAVAFARAFPTLDSEKASELLKRLTWPGSHNGEKK